MRYRVTRDVTPAECWWLEEPIEAGATLYVCHKATYGCVSPAGRGMTRDPEGGYPFFEVPLDALAPE